MHVADVQPEELQPLLLGAGAEVAALPAAVQGDDMKTKVRVTLRAETEVEMEVDHEPDEDPCDLTREERTKAIRMADPLPRWEVEDVET